MSYFPEIITNGLKFIIAKVSDSRKEIEIRLINDSITSSENRQFDIGVEGQNAGIVSANELFQRLNLRLTQFIDSNELDAVIPIGDGTYIPLVNVNYFVDTFLPIEDINKELFVIKLHNPLPPSFKKLDRIQILIQQTEIVSNDVVYGGRIEKRLQKFGYPLETDLSQNPFSKEVKETDTYQNKAQISSSIPLSRLESVLSGSSYKNRLVDYSEFENFIYFSSAEKRLQNFKGKLEKIQTHLSDISSSLAGAGQDYSNINTPAGELRKKKFKNVHTIVNNFTDYENWLYYDNQITSEKSVPGIGKEYTDSTAAISTSDNITQQFNKEGLDIIYVLSGSSTENIQIVEDKYKLQDIKFNNITSSVYLSFLMRASSSVSDNLLHKNTQTSSVPFYPMDTLHLASVLKPDATGSSYRRYVYKASGSHWAPADKNKLVGINVLNFNKNSSDIEILSGSDKQKKSIIAAGEYSNYLSYNTGSGKPVSGSFVPRGDLFNLSINATGDKNLNGIITDVKITSTDPSTITPFHHLYDTTSDEFLNWYNGMISSASFYDSQNIQRLVNNIPSSYLDDTITNQELITYVNTIGEFYDEYKTLIDDYYRLFNKGYSDYEQVPAKFNKILAENLGFNILPISDNNFLKIFGVAENLDNSEEYSNKVINNVLNNLSYLYKTKGTQNSIKALLNCYGLPSNVLKIREGAQNFTSYDQTILSNDASVSPIDVFDLTGSISFTQTTDNLHSLVINDVIDVNDFSFRWNSDNTITQSAVEAAFKIPPAPINTMSLMSSKNNNDTKELWHLQLFPSGSTEPNKAKLRFRVSPTAGGSLSSGIESSSLFVDSDFLDITDNSFFNVAVQKSSSGHDTSAEHTYNLFVGKSSRGRISLLNTKTLTIDGDSNSGGNKNFITGSKDKHLFFCNDFTGSVAQIKTWSTPLSFKAFKQHIFNKKSIVGNNFTSSIEELQYYYPLQENYNSDSPEFTLLDASTKQQGGNFNLNAGAFTSMSTAIYDTTLIETIKFPKYGTGGGTIASSDNLITIPTNQKLIDNLSYEKSVTRFNNFDEKDDIHNRELFLVRSPQEIINDFLVDNLGNLDFNDLFADPRDEFKTTYPDLDAFNEKLKQYKISVDMTRFIDATKKIFNSSFVESLKKLLPAKAKVTIGNVIKPTLTDRVKIPPLRERPGVELLTQPFAEKPDFEAPSTFNGELLSPPEHSFIGFQTPTSSLGVITHTTFDYEFGKASELDVRTKHIRDSLLYKNPQKLWGPSSNDLHFKGASPGKTGDYNTYHYEEDVVFTSISDPELVINTTSSYSGVENTNYTASKTFANKLLIQTSKTLPKRHMGITQQLYSTSSNDSPYGVILDSDTRIPTNHPAYAQYLKYYDNFYEGTKLGNYQNNQFPIGNSLWNTGQWWTPFSDIQEWEDVATASFYRVEYEGTNNNTLRIVRPEDTNQGNQSN